MLECESQIALFWPRVLVLIVALSSLDTHELSPQVLVHLRIPLTGLWVCFILSPAWSSLHSKLPIANFCSVIVFFSSVIFGWCFLIVSLCWNIYARICIACICTLYTHCSTDLSAHLHDCYPIRKITYLPENNICFWRFTLFSCLEHFPLFLCFSDSVCVSVP